MAQTYFKINFAETEFVISPPQMGPVLEFPLLYVNSLYTEKKRKSPFHKLALCIEGNTNLESV